MDQLGWDQRRCLVTDGGREYQGREIVRSPRPSFVVRLVWEASGEATVVVYGEVDQYTASCLRDVIETTVAAGATSVIIDLTEVAFLDAAGLGVAAIAARALGAERTAIVCHARLARVFGLTALDRVLTICRSREEACERLGRPLPATAARVPQAFFAREERLPA